MRTRQKRYQGRLAYFRGTVDRIGSRGERRFVLMKWIQDKRGREVAHHLWFRYTDALDRLKPVPGDRLEFRAGVRLYTRRDGTMDYALSDPATVWKVS